MKGLFLALCLVFLVACADDVVVCTNEIFLENKDYSIEKFGEDYCGQYNFKYHTFDLHSYQGSDLDVDIKCYDSHGAKTEFDLSEKVWREFRNKNEPK